MKPSNDYKLDYQSKTIRDIISGLEEVQQNSKLALVINRLQYLIYSADYGSEIEDLVGKDTAYVLGRIRKAIEECLLVDDRINAVDQFVLTQDRDILHVKFTVHTIFGNYIDEVEVQTNGL